MSNGVRLRSTLTAATQGILWRAATLVLTVTFFFLSHNNQLPTWAQSPLQTPNASPLRITEVHARPRAVESALGEWFEIANVSNEAVNLQFWRILNLGNDEHIFSSELWIPPGGYIVLARQGDPATNGGVQPTYVYTLLSIGKEREQLRLIDPDGQEMDSIAWGEGSALVATSGASLERVGTDIGAPWVTAHSPWQGSAGDWGSPGAPYAPPPPTPTPSPTPSLTPTLTPHPATPPRLWISEIMADPAAVSDELGEWIELYNGDTMPINLNGWMLADQGRDHTTLSGDVWLQPDSYLVLARVGDSAQNGGVGAQMLYTGLQLANEADELLLIAPWGVQVDQLLWHPQQNAVSNGASLERTTFDPAAPWATAIYTWPTSAGDLGSPGTPYVAPPPTPTPTATTTSTPLPTAPPAIPPRLFLSEIMVDPAAVGDDQGEWVELYNGDTVPINLSGWVLADQGRDRATLSDNLWLPPGGYVVLARLGDAAQNGGVAAHMVYTGLQLANEADELLLITPWGVTVDQLTWSSATLRIASGASLERATFDAADSWVIAHTPWPASAGDRGSPGAPHVAPPPTATPIATTTPVASPLPAATATATPSPTPLAVAWGRRALPSPLIIDQVYPQGGDQEYVVVRNWTGAPVPLLNWRLGDAEVPGDREGLLLLPADVVLAPGASWVIARHAATFRAQWGRAPDAEWSNSDPTVLQLLPDPKLAAGDLALADDGDELFLLDPDLALADAVAWNTALYAPLLLSGELDLPSQTALFQAPNATYLTVGDLRHRFLLLPPNPFATLNLPTNPSHAPVPLDGGMVAQWGSLGAASTFSPGGTAPPHVLLAAAGSLGLDFIAIADIDRVPTDMVVAAQSSGPIALPAWRWQHPEGHEAIIYSERKATLLGWGELFDFLTRENALAQLPPAAAHAGQRTPLLTADAISAPGGLGALQSVWQSMATPFLPVGNTTPPLPGATSLTPHYTGLAATGHDPAALFEALAKRRGWLTSSPGLWLTLQSSSGEWMGSTVAPVNELTLHIAYGDNSGASAGLALWQGDHLVRQLDLPPADGRWSVTLPAAPGTMLYVVATQLDGDFAITAPLYVAPGEGGKVLINEVLPAPNEDHNGDGKVDTGDEFIELINTGSAPLSLAAYSLGDAASLTGGRRFTFGADRFIGAGERLLLWRDDTDVSLNDEADLLQLFDAQGTLLDTIAWEKRPRGPSLSRVPDGGSWQMQTPPTPGQANQSYPPPEPPEEQKPDPRPVDPTNVGDSRSPNFMQATGPPGSVALAKLRGLEVIVEFRAQVVVPPGLYPSAIYLADPARDVNGAPLSTAGLGIQVYLRGGDFIEMQEGDWVLVRGAVVKSFRGEMEVQIEEPGQAWPFETGAPLAPLPITISDIGESLEARLVTFTGVVTGWQGDSLFLGDPANPDTPAIRVTVRGSLGWKRPYVQKGEQFQVTGVISQFGTASPWNDGYRVLVRFQSDLVKLEIPE